MATEVLGLYDNREDAAAATQALEQAGFARSDINLQSYNGAANDNTAVGGQSAESGWDRMLEKLHLMAPKHEAAYYSQGLRAGQTLVTVTTDDNDADRAADILDQYGAVDIDDNAAQYQTNQYQTDQYATATPNVNTNVNSNVNAQDGAVIPVVEEQLAVGKRQVQRGGVRVYQHVTERPVEEQVTLRDETVTVDRRPVNRAATDADFQNRDFTVTETAEEAVVAKSARVVEEVVVGKTANERVETVRDTVRRTDVDVDEMDADDDTVTTTDREVVR